MGYPDFRALCAELLAEMELFGFNDEYSENLTKKVQNALAVSRLSPLSDSQLEGIFMQNAKCVAAKAHLDLEAFISASRQVIAQSHGAK